MEGNSHITGSTVNGAGRKGPRIWLWPNLLSLDAPAVALLWQTMFIRSYHGLLGVPVAMLLAIAVWLIYAADRMLDAWRGQRTQARHQFYSQHWKPVLAVWAAIFGCGSALAWMTLSRAMLESGAVVAAGAVIYLVAVHAAPGIWRRPGWKEAMVSLVFALGASLAAWSHVESWADFMGIGLFCALCWMNCTSIEDWERGLPARGGVVAVAAVVACMAVLMSPRHPVLACAETASACGLVVLDRYWWSLSADRLRVLADVALLTPILFLQQAGRLT